MVLQIAVPDPDITEFTTSAVPTPDATPISWFVRQTRKDAPAVAFVRQVKVAEFRQRRVGPMEAFSQGSAELNELSEKSTENTKETIVAAKRKLGPGELKQRDDRAVRWFQNARENNVQIASAASKRYRFHSNHSSRSRASPYQSQAGQESEKSPKSAQEDDNLQNTPQHKAAPSKQVSDLDVKKEGQHSNALKKKALPDPSKQTNDSQTEKGNDPNEFNEFDEFAFIEPVTIGKRSKSKESSREPASPSDLKDEKESGTVDDKIEKISDNEEEAEAKDEETLEEEARQAELDKRMSRVSNRQNNALRNFRNSARYSSQDVFRRSINMVHKATITTVRKHLQKLLHKDHLTFNEEQFSSLEKSASPTNYGH